MKRGGPLRRRESLRDSYARRQREGFKQDAQAFVDRRFGKRTPLKKQSKSLRRRTAVYYEMQTAFLARPENEHCRICEVRRENGEPRAVRPATEVHHYRGRIGRLLTWEPGFVPSCRDCREWPHDNRPLAERLGVISPASIFNVFPE